MLNIIIKYMFLSNLILKTYCNLIISKSDNYNDITYWTISPKSYVCMCTPNSVLVKNPSLNASVWDTYCSNLNQCVWNEDEIILKTWYQSD